MAVGVGCWQRHNTTQEGSSEVWWAHNDANIQVIVIKNRLSVAATKEIKQWYQQKWIFASLSVYF